MTSNDSDDRGPEYSIFVGDLGPEVNEYVLVSLFQARFPSCKSAKIMTDAMSGQSRGYGFVRFSDENDQQRALVEMQGVYCGNRPMRISTATPKNRYVSLALVLALFFFFTFSLLHVLCSTFHWRGSFEILCQP
jgi:RNA recognition motif-containing protein